MTHIRHQLRRQSFGGRDLDIGQSIGMLSSRILNDPSQGIPGRVVSSSVRWKHNLKYSVRDHPCFHLAASRSFDYEPVYKHKSDRGNDWKKIGAIVVRLWDYRYWDSERGQIDLGTRHPCRVLAPCSQPRFHKWFIWNRKYHAHENVFIVKEPPRNQQ